MEIAGLQRYPKTKNRFVRCLWSNFSEKFVHSHKRLACQKSVISTGRISKHHRGRYLIKSLSGASTHNFHLLPKKSFVENLLHSLFSRILPFTVHLVREQTRKREYNCKFVSIGVNIKTKSDVVRLLVLLFSHSPNRLKG